MLDWDDDERSPFVPPPKFCNKMNNKNREQDNVLLGDILKDLYTDRPTTPTPNNSFVYDEYSEEVYQESVYADDDEPSDGEDFTDDDEDNSSEFNEHIQDDKMKKFMYT